jgi:asparagine synthase (glutamine-hydrolysing)
VLAIHRRYGDAVFSRLRGDFVVVLADLVARRCTVVRDQLGARSVVWHRAGRRVAIASEVPHMLVLLGHRPPPDAVAIAHWIALSGLPPGHTFYKDVNRLDPAHALTLEADREPVARRYWSPTYRRPGAIDLATAATGLRGVLRQAIERRSDAQTGVMLSGGLDSSTVAAISTLLPDGLRLRRAYSAVFPAHSSVDESALIRLLCDRFDLAGTQAMVRGGSALAGAATYIERWSTPPPSANVFFWLPLLRQAQLDGVTRLLDGEGGDEVLGLAPPLIADRLRRLRPRSAADLIRHIPGGGPHLTRRDVLPFMRSFGLKAAVPAWAHQAARRARGPHNYIPQWVLPGPASTFRDTDQTVAWKRIRGPRWWAFLVDATTRNMGPSLGYDHVRRRAQLCGIEQSHPIADVDVIEYMLSLPPELSFDPRHSRPVAREAVAGVTPDEVRLRVGKSAFNELFEGTLAGADLRPLRILLAPGAYAGEFVDWAQVQAALEEPPAGGERAQWAVSLWRVATLELWLRAQAGELRATVDALRLDSPDVLIGSNP